MWQGGWADPRLVGAAIAAGALLLAVAALAGFLLGDTSEGRFAGEETVDAIVQEIEAGDLEALLQRVRFHEEPCSRDPQPAPGTVLAPPLCPEGEPEGAPVEVFMSGNCEGVWVTSDQVLGAFAERLSGPQQVYAVVRMGPEAQSFGPLLAQYRIAYGRPGEPEFPFSGHVAVQDGDIVQLSTWCDNALEQLLTLASAGGEPVFVSPDLEAETQVTRP